MPLPKIINTGATQPPPAPVEPVIAAPEHKGVTVDSRYEPSASLLTHVEGSAWTVDYYRQVLDKDSPLMGQNVTQAAPYQQYTLIKGFELRVSGPLSTSQDDANKVMVVTGSANVYPFMVPNEGDMFLADIGDGREGVFKITRSERKSVFKEAIHTIEYQLIDYSTPVRLADLNAKVVKTLHFMRNFLAYGQNPMLHEEDYAILQQLEGHLKEMTLRYFHLFTSNEYKTLIIPGQDAATYDHFLTQAVLSFFTTYEAPDIRYVRKLNVGGDEIMQAPTLWDVLRERNLSLLKFCNRRAGLVSVRTFDRNPMLDGIYHSGIKYVVYPKDPEYGVDFELHGLQKPLAEEVLKPSLSRVKKLSDLIGDKEFEGLTSPDCPPIYKVTNDDYYVLSGEFYNDTNKQSLLERCVRDYLENKAPNIRVLLGLCKTYHAWGGLERYYYIPLLLMLIKASIRSI